MASRIYLLVVLALLLSVPAFCQNATGRITGIVTDPAGATVPGAKVTVVNSSTGARAQATTGPDGAYQVLDLPIGSYTVTVEQQGFAKLLTKDSELTINQTLRIDIQMRLGSISDSISVESQAAQVETASSTVGGTVTGSTISNLPLNGRNTLDLALTQRA